MELAYIRDPKLFDRDAQTRRSKARTDLKTQTGMPSPICSRLWCILLVLMTCTLRMVGRADRGVAHHAGAKRALHPYIDSAITLINAITRVHTAQERQDTPETRVLWEPTHYRRTTCGLILEPSSTKRTGRRWWSRWARTGWWRRWTRARTR